MKCEICFKYKYKNITTLPDCGHSLCDKCLNNIRKSTEDTWLIEPIKLLRYKNMASSIKCPFCRRYYYYNSTLSNYFAIPLIIEFDKKEFYYVCFKEMLWIFKFSKPLFEQLIEIFNLAEEKKTTLFYKLDAYLDLKPKYDKEFDEIKDYEFIEATDFLTLINNIKFILNYQYNLCDEGLHTIRDFINSKELENEAKINLINKFKEHLNNDKMTTYLPIDRVPVDIISKLYENTKGKKGFSVFSTNQTGIFGFNK